MKNKSNFKDLIKWLVGLTVLNFGVRLLTAYSFAKMLDLPYEWGRIFKVIPRIDFSTVDVFVFKSISTISLLLPGLCMFLIFMYYGFLTWKHETYCENLWKLRLLVLFLFMSLVQYFFAIAVDYRVEYANFYYGFFIIALAWIYAWFGYTRVQKRCNNLGN